MKLKWTIVLPGLAALLTLASIAHATPHGGETGNGGDAYSKEFIEQATNVANLLVSRSSDQFRVGVSVDTLKAAISKTRVITEDHVFLDGAEVDAKNIPDENLIDVSRSRWDEMQSMPRRRSMLALHEYLGIVGAEVNSYPVSTQIIRFLGLEPGEEGQPLLTPGVPNADGYVRWPNGGGYVHVKAQVDPSATIISSTIGPNVEIAANVTIINSTLTNECQGEKEKLYLETGALVTSSTIHGNVEIDDGTRTVSSYLDSPCDKPGQVQNNSTVESSHLFGDWLIEDHSVVDNSEIDGTKSNMEISEHVVVQSSRVANTEIEHDSIIQGSIIDESLIENDSVVKASNILGKNAGISQNCIISGSTLEGKTWINKGTTLQGQHLVDGKPVAQQ